MTDIETFRCLYSGPSPIPLKKAVEYVFLCEGILGTSGKPYDFMGRKFKSLFPVWLWQESMSRTRWSEEHVGCEQGSRERLPQVAAAACFPRSNYESEFIFIFSLKPHMDWHSSSSQYQHVLIVWEIFQINAGYFYGSCWTYDMYKGLSFEPSTYKSQFKPFANSHSCLYKNKGQRSYVSWKL